MKKFWIFIGILIICPGVYLFLKKQNQNEPYPTGLLPRIEKTTFSIQEFSTEETTMLIKLVIDNRAPVGFAVKEINYVLYADGQKLAKSPFEKEIDFKGNGTTEVEIPVKLKNQLLIDLSERAKETEKDSAEYKVSANFKVDVFPVENQQIDVDFSEKLPIIMIPDIEVDHWDLEKLSLKESEFSFTVTVHNPNNFPFQFKNVKYFFQVEEEVWTEGNLPEATHIPANGSAQLTIPLQLNVDQVFKSLGELIQKRKESSFNFNLEGQLISENNMINDSKFLTIKEGKLKEILELNKQK